MEFQESTQRCSSTDKKDAQHNTPAEFQMLTNSAQTINSKRYLHSGLTPRLNDLARTRYRSSSTHNVSKNKDTSSEAHSNSRERSRSREDHEAKHDTRERTQDDVEARSKRQRVLTSAHRRWRSSDRLTSRRLDGNPPPKSPESHSTFFAKSVLQMTGKRPRICSEPPVSDGLALNIVNTNTIIPEVDHKPHPSHLHSIVKSEDDLISRSGPKTNVNTCDEMLGGHPFILQDDVRVSDSQANIPVIEQNEFSRNTNSLCKDRVSNHPHYNGTHSNKKEMQSGVVHGNVIHKSVSGENTSLMDTIIPGSSEAKQLIRDNLISEYASADIPPPEPPRIARKAWGVGVMKQEKQMDDQHLASEANEHLNDNSVPEVSTRPVRHWANIEHRAAARKSSLSNSESEESPSLAKSKSTWRLHAARARESVANLLNFTKGKDSSSSPRCLKSSSKFISHHKSSPSLTVSYDEDSKRRTSQSSEKVASYGSFEKQKSSPELYPCELVQHSGGSESEKLSDKVMDEPSENVIDVAEMTDCSKHIHKESQQSLYEEDDGKITKARNVRDGNTILNNSGTSMECSMVAEICQSTSMTDSLKNEHCNSAVVNESSVTKSLSVSFPSHSSLVKSDIQRDGYENTLSSSTHDDGTGSTDLHKGANTITGAILSSSWCAPSPPALKEEEYYDQEMTTLSDHGKSPASSPGLLRALQAAQKRLKQTKKSPSSESNLNKDSTAGRKAVEEAINEGMQTEVVGSQGHRDNNEESTAMDHHDTLSSHSPSVEDVDDNVEEISETCDVDSTNIKENKKSITLNENEQSSQGYNVCTSADNNSDINTILISDTNFEGALHKWPSTVSDFDTNVAESNQISAKTNIDHESGYCVKDNIPFHNIKDEQVNSTSAILNDKDKIVEHSQIDDCNSVKAKVETHSEYKEMVHDKENNYEIDGTSCLNKYLSDCVESVTNTDANNTTNEEQSLSEYGNNVIYFHKDPNNILIERQDSILSVSSSGSNKGGRRLKGGGGGGGGGRSERSKRVEEMLNNQVFKKHLAKHADTIERRVLGGGKRGLRKAVSNLDLSSEQSDALNDVMKSLFNTEDDASQHEDGTFQDRTCERDGNGEGICMSCYDSSHKVSRCVSLRENSSETTLGIRNVSDEDCSRLKLEKNNSRFLRKAASSFLLRNTPGISTEDSDSNGAMKNRRASVSCSDDHKKGPNDSFMNKRRRMYIPSFREYRQNKHVNIDSSTANVSEENAIGSIYVIDESEQDEGVQNMDKSETKEIKPITSSTGNLETTRLMRKKQEKAPVFAHPAIVITEEHCTQIKNPIWSFETRSSRRKKKSDKNKMAESGGNIDRIHVTPQEEDGDKSVESQDYKIGETACSHLMKKSNDDQDVNEPKHEDTTKLEESKCPEISSQQTSDLSDHSLNVFGRFGFNDTTNVLDLEISSSSTEDEDVTSRDSVRQNLSPKHINKPLVMDESLGFSLRNHATGFPDNVGSTTDDDSTYNASSLSTSSHSPFSKRSDTMNHSASTPNISSSVDSRQSPTPGILISKSLGSSFDEERVSLPDQEMGGRNIVSVKSLQLSEVSADVYDNGDGVGQGDDMSRVNVTLQRWSPTSSASDSDQSNKTSVLRSTSDVSATLSDEKERRRRDRKERPYKSDPFTGTVTRPPALLSPDTPIHNALSVSTSCSFHSLDELDEQSDNNSFDDDQAERRKRLNRLSNASSISEDSGVAGPGWGDSKPSGGCGHCAAYHIRDASSPLSPGGFEFESMSSVPAEYLCNKCVMRKRERKETIQEIAETEKRYGRDLAILKEEFYRPMKSTSLLTLDQLDSIFMNLDELITVHKRFMGKLTTALVNAVREGDEGLANIEIGGIFVESSKMFLAFENYCVGQTQSNALLEQLEKDKELLKVFLQAAQNENPKMRRMHLKTFLMMPVQRVMKYPLLLGRLYRVTPTYHSDKTNIRQARDNIEDILEHINSKTQSTSRPKSRALHIQGYSLSEKMEVNRMALDVLGWSKKEVCDIITSRLWYGQVPDHTWASRRARNVKFSMVHAALLSHGRPTESPVSPRDPPLVLQVAMVLVREKGGKYQVVRDPLLMDRCVVTVDPEYDHVFEIHEQSKDTYLFKAETRRETKIWTQHLKQLSRKLGYWRRRRNGLPNVLLKTI